MRVVSILALLFLAPCAFGCQPPWWSDDPDQTISVAYKSYPAIFLGTAETVTMLPGSYEFQETVFSVHKVWKGDIGQTITTKVSLLGFNCGFEFEQGVTYLVFGDLGDDGSSAVYSYSHTLPKKYATVYIEALDKIHASN